MSGAVRLRDDFTAVDLRQLAKSRNDPGQIRRLLALAAVYDGMKRSDAAKIGGMDRQTLRDWVHRFNEEGPDGLINRKGPERARRLSEEQMHELAELVETGLLTLTRTALFVGAVSICNGSSKIGLVWPITNAPSPSCLLPWAFLT